MSLNDPRHFKMRQAVDNLNRAEVRTIEVALKAIRTSRKYEIQNQRNLFVRAEQTSERMLMELSSYIAGNEYEEETHHYVPKTWWDHFKKEWFPKWLERRFPAEYKLLSKKRSVTILFPDIELPQRVLDTLEGFERGFKV